MYCMIVHNQMKSGQVDAVVAGLEKDFVPVMKKARGFRGAYMMAGPKGEYMAFMLWDTRADADAYAASRERDTALAGIADKLEGPMKLDFWEVRLAVTV